MDAENNVNNSLNTNQVDNVNVSSVTKDSVTGDVAQPLKSDDNTENSIKDTNNVHDVAEKSHEAASSDSINKPPEKHAGHAISYIDNSSLCNLLIYSSDDDSDTESSVFDSNDDDEEDEGIVDSPQGAVGKAPDKTAKKNPKSNVDVATKKINELGLDQLPPVPDLSSLKIDVAGDDCEQMGVISSIVDRLVIIESLPNIPAYDIDTLLFLQKGKVPLGYVHDVLGPVSSPMYAVRFNTREEIDSLNISIGLPVYSAPKTEHTQYVFLKQLLEIKGSDASWTDDAEVPVEFADFSDDEDERSARRRHVLDLNPNKKRNGSDKHKSFEKNMNVRNILDTRLHKIRDSFEPQNKRHVPNTKTSHVSKHNHQSNVQNPFRFTPMTRIGGMVPSLQPVRGYNRLPPYAMGPSIYTTPPNYRNVPFVPMPTPNMPHFHGVPPIMPSSVFMNPPPPGVDVSNETQQFYRPPPPPPSQPHINWFMSGNLAPTSSGTFNGSPYYQKP